MSIIMRVMEKVAKVMPVHEDPMRDARGNIGKPVTRLDGSQKVRGQATFTAEFKVANLSYASLVFSSIAKGKISSIDEIAAREVPGVIQIMTYKNAPKMKAPPTMSMLDPTQGFAGSSLPVMQDEVIHWNGQPVAVVVAETQEQADEAASLLVIEYEKEEAATSFDALESKAFEPKDILGEKSKIEIGDAEKDLTKAAFAVDDFYDTPRNTHNALEAHATIAEWLDDDHLKMHESTQFVFGVQDLMVRMFGLKKENVEVISPFIGGAFGGKAAMWNHTALCAAAAKLSGRPVKLVLPRKGVFHAVGGRTVSHQRVAIGANKEGKFTSIIQTGNTAATEESQYAEQFSFPVRHLYSADHFLIGQKIVCMNMVANTWMRAPGDSIGTFALESAIDELAHKMKMDPIELRRINEPKVDPTKGTEFSSRHLIECYQSGAEKFGWEQKEPRSQNDGEWLIGQGVATAYYPGFRFPATARIKINAAGDVTIQAAANEMGMGTATVQTQHAAERLGVCLDKVTFEYGNSNLPQSTMAGGSSQTVSIIAAVAAAAEKAQEKLLKLAGKESPLAGLKIDDIESRDGGMWSKADASKGETYAAIVGRSGEDFEIEGSSGQAFEIMKYSMHSYGAQFCEVRVHSETGEIRVSRWVGSFDCGRILNPKTTESQFRGGIIMGIGQALHEETHFDPRNGRVANPSLGEYHVPCHLDIPEIEVMYSDQPDEKSPMGARGVGEIGTVGASAAIANAVFNATGKRIRSLPITLDKVMTAD